MTPPALQRGASLWSGLERYRILGAVPTVDAAASRSADLDFGLRRNDLRSRWCQAEGAPRRGTGAGRYRERLSMIDARWFMAVPRTDALAG